METPQEVLDMAWELIESFGEEFEYLGEHDGKQVFKFIFPEDTHTGYPYVYLYDPELEELEELTGMEALDYLLGLWM